MGFREVTFKDRIKDNLEKHIGAIECGSGNYKVQQKTGRIHGVRMDKSTFEKVEEFKYLGTTLTNQNSIAEEIKSGNACYNSVQNLLSSRLLCKN